MVCIIGSVLFASAFSRRFGKETAQYLDDLLTPALWTLIFACIVFLDVGGLVEFLAAFLALVLVSRH